MIDPAPSGVFWLGAWSQSLRVLCLQLGLGSAFTKTESMWWNAVCTQVEALAVHLQPVFPFWYRLSTDRQMEGRGEALFSLSTADFVLRHPLDAKKCRDAPALPVEAHDWSGPSRFLGLGP